MVKTPVATSQVAPSILHELGLDPQSLKSVRSRERSYCPACPFRDHALSVRLCGEQELPAFYCYRRGRPNQILLTANLGQESAMA